MGEKLNENKKPPNQIPYIVPFYLTLTSAKGSKVVQCLAWYVTSKKVDILVKCKAKHVYAVSVVNKFIYKFREVNLQATYSILHYWKGTPRKEIMFKKNNKLLFEAYTDAEYADSLVDRRFTYFLEET